MSRPVLAVALALVAALAALLALLAGHVAPQVAPAAPLARPAALLQPSFRADLGVLGGPTAGQRNGHGQARPHGTSAPALEQITRRHMRPESFFASSNLA